MPYLLYFSWQHLYSYLLITCNLMHRRIVSLRFVSLDWVLEWSRECFVRPTVERFGCLFRPVYLQFVFVSVRAAGLQIQKYLTKSLDLWRICNMRMQIFATSAPHLFAKCSITNNRRRRRHPLWCLHLDEDVVNISIPGSR